MWTRCWIKIHAQAAFHYLCAELERFDMPGFKDFTQLFPKEFHQLLEKVTLLIEKQNTNYRECISPAERLMITLLPSNR